MGVGKLFTETTTVPCALEKDVSRELSPLDCSACGGNALCQCWHLRSRFINNRQQGSSVT